MRLKKKEQNAESTEELSRTRESSRNRRIPTSIGVQGTQKKGSEDNQAGRFDRQIVDLWPSWPPTANQNSSFPMQAMGQSEATIPRSLPKFAYVQCIQPRRQPCLRLALLHEYKQ